MSDLETKNLKVQIELLKGIQEADSMIQNVIQNNSSNIFAKLIQPKMPKTFQQETIEFTKDEFNQLAQYIEELSSSSGFRKLNAWIDKDYIRPKEEKVKILNMLK